MPKPKTPDDYLDAIDADQRTTLESLRKTIRAAVPEAVECLCYGLPAFRLDGKPLVAFRAAANHCAFHPMSGSIVATLKTELRDYDTSKGTIRFSPNKPLPATLVRKLLKARSAEIRHLETS